MLKLKPVVYFIPLAMSDGEDKINLAVDRLLNAFTLEQKFSFEKDVPLKVSFGERGNKTFINQGLMLGAIDFLKKKKIKSVFIETNVLYRGERTNKKDHTALAKSHGFTALPIIIADGDIGEDYSLVEINKNHFKSCMIAKKLADSKQVFVISHFKGHMLAGFGGAIKQLAMGFASRGGKLAQHVNSIPTINFLTCKKCWVCVDKCPVHAISKGRISASIDKNKCIGCAACIANCPYGVIKINWLKGLTSSFHERLVEYAYAANLNKNNLYLTYALNMTKGCDCEGKKMNPITEDLGVFLSTDPVACDKAVFDLLNARDKKDVFKAKNTFNYAKKIGFGSLDYKLKELKL
jgi:uncharacterized Fe-S center protein